MAVLRQIAITLAVLVATSAGAQEFTFCDPEQTETVKQRTHRCPEDILRLDCGGELFDLREDGPACCPIRANREVWAYCGSDEQIAIRCRAGATEAMVRATERGLGYRCLTVIATEPPAEDSNEDFSETSAEAPSGEGAGAAFTPEEGATGTNVD